MTAEAAVTWDVSWHDALAQLELDADRAEQLIRDGRLLDADVPAWTPPQLGPMPANLVLRAHSILDRAADHLAGMFSNVRAGCKFFRAAVRVFLFRMRKIS